MLYHQFLVDSAPAYIVAKPRVHTSFHDLSCLVVEPDAPILEHDLIWRQEQLTHCPFTAEFARGILCWAATLQWAADHPVGDTSCCELYAAFVLETCTRAPVKISGTCARGRPKLVWAVRDESLEADVVNTVMSQDVHAFTHAIKWIYKQGISVFPASLQPGAASLVHIGRSVHKAHGVMLRTKFISNIRAATVLQDHFAHNGRYLNFIFHP